MTTLNTDYTAPDFNSYATTAEMDVIISAHSLVFGDAGWDALTDEAKIAQILNAVRFINKQEWAGEKSLDVIAAAMQFPRVGLPGSIVTAIPDQVKELLGCLIHAQLTGAGASPLGNTTGAVMLKKKTVGKVTTEYDAAPVSFPGVDDDKNPCISELIPDGWVNESDSFGGIGSVGLRRGL